MEKLESLAKAFLVIAIALLFFTILVIVKNFNILSQLKNTQEYYIKKYSDNFYISTLTLSQDRYTKREEIVVGDKVASKTSYIVEDSDDIINLLTYTQKGKGSQIVKKKDMVMEISQYKDGAKPELVNPVLKHDNFKQTLELAIKSKISFENMGSTYCAVVKIPKIGIFYIDTNTGFVIRQTIFETNQTTTKNYSFGINRGVGRVVSDKEKEMMDKAEAVNFNTESVNAISKSVNSSQVVMTNNKVQNTQNTQTTTNTNVNTNTNVRSNSTNSTNSTNNSNNNVTFFQIGKSN